MRAEEEELGDVFMGLGSVDVVKVIVDGWLSQLI
jgi:hypothetical protein